MPFNGRITYTDENGDDKSEIISGTGDFTYTYKTTKINVEVESTYNTGLVEYLNVGLRKNGNVIDADGGKLPFHKIILKDGN